VIFHEGCIFIFHGDANEGHRERRRKTVGWGAEPLREDEGAAVGSRTCQESSCHEYYQLARWRQYQLDEEDHP
jgi:hypothetical protein